MAYNLLEDAGDQLVVDDNKKYYEELVGDNKKYKDNETLAKAALHKDVFIEQLQRENKELREDYLKLNDEYKAGPKLQELIDRLSSTQKLPLSEEPLDADVKDKAPAFDMKEIESLVSKKIQETKLSEKQAENFNLVKSKLTERFGPKYQTHVKQQIEDLGLNENEFNQMAVTHPQLLIKTLGLDNKSQNNSFQAPPRSDTRTDQFAPTGATKRTWAYYQNMRKENPTQYHDPKTQLQLMRDAEALGEAFQDGDWNVI